MLPTKTAATSVRLHSATRRALEQAVKRQGSTLSGFLESAVRAALPADLRATLPSHVPALGPETPLIKWVGGKRKLLPTLVEHLPNREAVLAGRARFFEPFLGGGALFLHLQARSLAAGHGLQAVLNDSSPELVNLYCQVRDRPDALARELKKESYSLNETAFRTVRAWDREPGWGAARHATRRAARFLYLNKTAFNGLWRVNRAGHFNVPYGAYARLTLPDAATLKGYARLLAGVELSCGDFAASVATAQAGDVVYFDPPYAPASATASFTAYTRAGFDAGMQERLAALLAELSERGVNWVLSNSDTPFARALFGDLEGATVHNVQMARSINRDAAGRGKVDELLVVGPVHPSSQGP